MKRHTFIAALLLVLAGGARAQENSLEAVLLQIETNNPELQAASRATDAQKLANRAENNLPDPTLSYSYLWDSRDKSETVGELSISQGFDFPTLYVTRNRLNRLRGQALDARQALQRQTLLLQAQEACLDLILLQRQQALLDERLKNAEDLAAFYRRRLETGDANALETNKINLELLNVRTESRTNRIALAGKLGELTALNGGKPLDLGADTTLADYPLSPLPADFAPLCDALLASSPELQALQAEGDAARKQVSASRQGWLPKLEFGYRRNTETGHPLNGVVVGFSFPFFANRGQVKAARKQAQGIRFQQDNARVKARTELWQLYEEARSLHASLEEYRRTFEAQQDLALLRQALEGGQISMIEYFVEISVVYQSKANLLQLENQYQKVLARMYKSRL